MGKCGTPARRSVAFHAVLTVEIGWLCRCGLGKTKGLFAACSLFHARKTSQANSESGTGSEEPGVFTSLPKRISLLSSPHYSRKLTSRRIFCRCETMHDERRIWINGRTDSKAVKEARSQISKRNETPSVKA